MLLDGVIKFIESQIILENVEYFLFVYDLYPYNKKPPNLMMRLTLLL